MNLFFLNNDKIDSFFKGDISLKIIQAEKFSPFSYIYPFTNENIKAYYKHFNFNEKSILTVSSSGDHLLNAFFYGAKKVTCFDKNMLANFYTELKFQAARQLNFNEFKNFFYIENNSPFSFELYKKFSGNLNSNTKYFFDRLYEYFDFDGFKIRTSDLFRKKYDKFNKERNLNPYLENEYTFLQLQEKILNKNVDYLGVNIKFLHKYVDNQEFDYIFTSNISDYIHKKYFGKNYLTGYSKNVIEPLLKKINYGGVIIFAYLNDFTNPVQMNRNDLYIKHIRENIFNGDGYNEFTFISSLFGNKCLSDSILYITKQ